MGPYKKRSYTEYAQDPVAMLGHFIEIARKDRKMTASELCERAGFPGECSLASKMEV